jgi:hypothetical protein
MSDASDSPWHRSRAVLASCFVLVVAFAAATAIVGWWGVPVVGLVWGWWASRWLPRPVPVALVGAASATGAWAALLWWTAFRGPLGRLAVLLGEIIGVPASLLIALTLLFAALLAGSASNVFRRGPRTPR